MPAVRLTITGTVQGVFYRATANEIAGKLELRGWIRNRPDGSVEAHAEGPWGALETFIEWCRKGPPSAKVEKVLVEEVPEEGLPPFATRRD